MSGGTQVLQSGAANDRATTLRNRAQLRANKNLLFWYRELYRDQFRDFSNPAQLSVLEIRNGTSPLKQFLPNVITSDVLDLDYLDLVFDCLEIDKLDTIQDKSIDVITLTNVLHHLKSPIAFLNRAAGKLKSGSKVIATEPLFSLLSTPIFKYLHHEPADFQVSEPELGEVQGRLNETFNVASLSARPFSSLSYMATGRISHRLPMPGFLYRVLFLIDRAFSHYFSGLCASFFTITLTRR